MGVGAGIAVAGTWVGNGATCAGMGVATTGNGGTGIIGATVGMTYEVSVGVEVGIAVGKAGATTWITTGGAATTEGVGATDTS